MTSSLIRLTNHELRDALKKRARNFIKRKQLYKSPIYETPTKPRGVVAKARDTSYITKGTLTA